MYVGIKELLETLKDKGKSINIVTLKSRETTIKILEFLGINQYFDNIIGMCNEFPNQNKRDMLKYAIQKIDANKAIMIGNRKSDIEAGNYCKIDTIAVLYGMDSFEILSTVNPTFFAKNTNEIYKIIGQEK